VLAGMVGMWRVHFEDDVFLVDRSRSQTTVNRR
jgi:hypothetical protein